MQDVIRLLPESLANQIAAGEVVQRPASVVKELLENAIDAGSSNIQLIIKDAGKLLVQIIDDGSGMSETDARMSFERHATSKIKSSNDLFAIRTFGFRGEALASIAAVAQVEMRTRRAEEEVGTRLCIEASEIKEQEPVATPVGTSIAVKNLFFNVPARRKFLKSNPVETKHIVDEFQRVALANPEVSMTLFQDDTELYSLKPGNLAKRVVALFGKQYQGQLIPCQEDLEVVNVKGYIGKPEAAKKTRGEQFFFVNNRFIKHSALHHAVMSAYEGLLADGAFPFYLLAIEIDPKEVDVNVHPTKTEVKFSDERTLYAVVSAAVKQALASHGVAPSIDFAVNVNFDRDEASPMAQGTFAEFHALPDSEEMASISHSLEQERHDNPYTPPTASFPSRIGSYDEQLDNSPEESIRVFQSSNWGAEHATFQQWQNEFPNDNFPTGRTLIPSGMEQLHLSSRANELPAGGEETSAKPTDKIEPLQIRNQYILYQVKSGVILLDQEAAHERILYERFLHEIQQHAGVSQRLLFSRTLNINPSDLALLQEFEQEIRALGFHFEVRSAQELVVTGIPVIIQDSNEQEVLEGIIEQIKYNKYQLSLDRVENIARSLAKRTSVKRGQVLHVDEMRSMIERLFACSNPNYAPDGRKTIVMMSVEQLEALFM